MEEPGCQRLSSIEAGQILILILLGMNWQWSLWFWSMDYEVPRNKFSQQSPKALFDLYSNQNKRNKTKQNSF